MHKELLALAILFAGAAVALPAHADASVKTRLDTRGITYKLDDYGDYVVTYEYEKSGRTQLAFVSRAAQSVGGFSVREVFSPAGSISVDGIDGSRALELLAASRGAKLGSWEIGGDILYYVIKLPDSVDAAQLESALRIVASVADDMEIELSGTKDSL